MNKLTDDDEMSFGKYKGMKMQHVPASYLHWLWTENKNSFNRTDLKTQRVIEYITENIAALKEEHEDGIW